MLQSNERYIPYLSVAEAAVEDGEHELFFRSLLPDANEEVIGLLTMHATGVMLGGIDIGLELSSNDPISAIEAYKAGEADGFIRAQEGK